MLPSFHIGPLPVYGDLILAPMDGFSDLPYRSLCRELGSALSYTGFINALDVLHGHPHLEEKYRFLPEERPVVFQVFDNDPDRLLQAAQTLQKYDPDAIDINMGCSVNCVSGRGAGAGLLRTPLKVARIFRKLTAALNIPVTAKIRLGWDDGTRNYSFIARIIEENGGALIAVHGRTRSQGLRGQADWDAIAQVKQTVSLPVIGNGDVRTVADIARLKAHTGCDGVMIGRAAIGNPWIFSRLDRQQISPEQVRSMMLRHLERSIAFYGEKHGLIFFRKHASRYLSPWTLSKEIRAHLLTAEQPADFLALLENLPLPTAV